MEFKQYLKEVNDKLVEYNKLPKEIQATLTNAGIKKSKKIIYYYKVGTYEILHDFLTMNKDEFKTIVDDVNFKTIINRNGKFAFRFVNKKWEK